MRQSTCDASGPRETGRFMAGRCVLPIRPALADRRLQSRPVEHRAGGLVGLAGFADGGVEVGPLLGLVLGLEQVADRTEAPAEAGWGRCRVSGWAGPPR